MVWFGILHIEYILVYAETMSAKCDVNWCNHTGDIGDYASKLPLGQVTLFPGECTFCFFSLVCGLGCGMQLIVAKFGQDSRSWKLSSNVMDSHNFLHSDSIDLLQLTCNISDWLIGVKYSFSRLEISYFAPGSNLFLVSVW